MSADFESSETDDPDPWPSKDAKGLATLLWGAHYRLGLCWTSTFDLQGEYPDVAREKLIDRLLQARRTIDAALDQLDYDPETDDMDGDDDQGMGWDGGPRVE